MAEPCRRKIQELIGLMQKNLECSICLDMMNNPVSTNCGHQFCRFCLMEFLERKKQVPCPLCKKMITKRSLMNRSQLGQMVENVRSLISAFQCDTGMLFSPPRGPQTVDLFPCTPDSIHAKTTTDTNRRSVTGAEKKVVKGKNVRIGRRKTVDNSDLGLTALSEQSSKSGASRRVSLITNKADHLQSDGIVLQQRNKRIMNKARINVTENASSELLQCIENGDHCSTRVENLETEPYVNSSKLQENTVASVSQNGADSKEKEQKGLVSQAEDSAEITLPQEIYENFSPRIKTPGQFSKSPNSVKEVFGCQKTLERDKLESHSKKDNSDSRQDTVIESGPLFQTPLVSNTNKLSYRRAVRSEVPKHTARELRSRQKQVKPADETKIQIDCTEQLTPDTRSENVNPFGHTQSNHDGIKTYSKKGLSKQDKEANKKVMEWLESVTAKDKRKAVKSDRSSVNEMLKEEIFKKSKKGLKLKADEEKMGQKLKHLAEHVNVNVSDSCFGFDDNDSENENSGVRLVEITGEKSSVTKNVLDNKNHTESSELKETVSCVLRKEVQITESDSFCPEKVNKNGICIMIDSENRAESDNYVDSNAKTDEIQYYPVESVKNKVDVENSVLLNKKRIFKTRLLNKENVADIQEDTTVVVPKSVSPESKCIDRVVKDSSKAIALCPGVENKTMSEQSLPNSDPYEFKSSQNTPKKVGKRKRQKANLGKGKKNRSQAKDSMQGLKSTKPVIINKTSSKNVHEKSKSIETQRGIQQKSILDDTPVSCTQEEIKKMSNKINQAEDYDLLTCTQEAVDSIEDNDILRKVDGLDSDTNVTNKFNSEIIEIDADIEERKLKSSQQKRVRFREPVISDFIQPGKIDILGYRKAKEDATKVIENKHSKDTEQSDFKANKRSESAGPALLDAQKLDVCINNNIDENIATVDIKDKTGKTRKLTERNDGIKSSPTCKTTISSFSSPNGVFKNPMMTPTILKSGKKETSGYLSFEPVEEEANSSGTDDLEINPEQDQFEEPNFDIQPDEIKDRLSSQELFVQNVLSTPKESATMRPSPQLIEETPAIFVVPKLTTFQNYENSKRARKKSSKSQTITGVAETPLIELNESPCLESYEEKHQVEKEIASSIEDGSLGFLNEIIGRNEKVIQESDKTASPNDAVILSNDESKLFSNNSHNETMTRSLESDDFEEEGSGENSVSLLDQESQFLVHMNRSKISKIHNGLKRSEKSQLIQNKPSVSSVTPNSEDIADKVVSVERSPKSNKVSDSYQEILKDKPVMKTKKKRKSFMLDDDETLKSRKQSPPPEVIVAQDNVEQKPKRKRLSRSNSPRLQELRNISQDTRDESVSKDIKESDISLQNGDLNRKETGVNKTKEDSIKQNSEVMVSDSPANIKSFKKDFTCSKNQSQTDAYDILPSAESLQAAELTQENNRITDEDFTVYRDSDVLRVAESIQSDISTVDPQNMDLEAGGASQTACVSQGNNSEKASDSQVVLRENSFGTSKTKIETHSIHMVPETEMIDFGSIPQNVNAHESHICERMDVEYSDACTQEEKKMDDGNCEDAIGDKTQVTNKMLQISQPQSKDRSKKYENTGLEIKENRLDLKQRHSSGILISPEENVLDSSSKGSPEDIFNIDSEMPFVDNSPFDETIKLAYLSEDETITNSCIEAQDNFISRNVMQRNECEKTVSMNSVSDETDIENIKFNENGKVKNSKLEENNNSRKQRNSVKDKNRTAKQKKPDSDSESDLSQQDRKKRRSGLKGARGFAGRNKHSNSSGCSSDLTSPISKKLVSHITRSENKSDPIEPEVNESCASRFVPNVNSPKSHSLTNDANLSNSHISNNKQHQFVIKQAHETAQDIKISIQKNCNDNNTKDGSESELSDHNGIEDLPDLSQKCEINSSNKTQNAEIIVKKEMSNCEAKQNSLRNKTDRVKNISHASSLECKMVQCKSDEDHMKNTVIDNELEEKLSQTLEKLDEPEQCNDANDTSSSEFELNSSPDEVDSHKKINEEEEINNCIKEARNRIMDLENTFSEILSDGDHESPQNSQESEKNTNTDNMHNSKTQKSRKTDWTLKGVKLENCNGDKTVKCVVKDSESMIESLRHTANVVSSSPQPDATTEEPMEVLESDIEPSESDSDDGPVIRKKSKKAVIADSSTEDEDDSSRHMNMTSSSAFSSQSENLTTQDRNALEKDLERMAREMEALKSQLRKGQGHSTDTENSTKTGGPDMSKSQTKSIKDSLDHQVVTVDDDTDIDELIEMDDSDRDHSDNDLFMSPPPLSLSQDHVAETASKQPTQTDQEECRTPSEKTQTSNTSYKPRSVLGALDVNRPPSPGRRIPRAFVATGLTLHQVQEVKKLASLNDCKFYNKFNESVTHVIVKPAAESEYLCDRTLKLFQGIANKCWIVNYYWVVDSRHAGHLLPEGPYEIQGDTANGEQHLGPLKSRISPTRLFDNFMFMCVGDCPGLSVDDMVSLIQTCGGEIVPSVDQLRSGEKTSLIVTCSEVEDDDGDVQLSSQDVARFNKMYKSHGVVTVSREWILDSLTLYQLQPLKEYVITSIKNMVVPKIIPC